ncbi:MAG: nitric oxide synthase oxygenase [Pseudomonadota bacterium]
MIEESPAYDADLSPIETEAEFAEQATEYDQIHDGFGKLKHIVASSFYRQPITDPVKEAESYFRLIRQEGIAAFDVARRLKQFETSLSDDALATAHTKQELEYGAKVAWRNSIRCIGRMFWPSLKVFDARDLTKTSDIFDAILAHIDWASNGGNLRSALTVFRPSAPELRILNTQLILYAGYMREDGTVLGDPKNVVLTKFVQRLGWTGKGTEFDILPLVIANGNSKPELFEIPGEKIIEVNIRHPEHPKIARLGLKWFALPAVANMALDMGGITYPAAPSSGIYQGTEIGSFNLGDPRRYNKLEQIAQAMGLDATRNNPLWRDQAIVELNRAVVHSFNTDGVTIYDHHSMADSFKKFCQREDAHGREIYGHWPWITPPMSSNLSWVWHEKKFKKRIVKPGYFYQHPPPRVANILNGIRLSTLERLAN